MRRFLHSDEAAALASLLRDLRHEAGLTQAEVAKRLKTTQSLVAKIEGGERRVDLLELRELAHALGTDLRTLVDRFEAGLAGGA